MCVFARAKIFRDTFTTSDYFFFFSFARERLWSCDYIRHVFLFALTIMLNTVSRQSKCAKRIGHHYCTLPYTPWYKDTRNTYTSRSPYVCVDTLSAMLTQSGKWERCWWIEEGRRRWRRRGTRRGGSAGGGERERLDGTNAQPGYHINLAAYKFARDRVKPLQAAGRGWCKSDGEEGEKRG